MNEIQNLLEIPLFGGPVEIRGALEIERTEAGFLPRRLPSWTRAQHQDAGMERQATSPSGVRLAFRTSATAVELDVLTTLPTVDEAIDPGDTGVFELLVGGSTVRTVPSPVGNLLVLTDFSLPGDLVPGPIGTVRFSGLASGMKDVEIWLPQWVRTELVGLRADASVEPPTPTGRRVWLHHGSSISQCNEADTPTGVWPVVAAARSGVDLVNVGLSGNCFLDPFVARSIRDAPAELISLKLGINLTSRGAYRLRTFGPTVHGFLDTVREGHPDVPLLVVSPIICPAIEDMPGPTEWVDDVFTPTGSLDDIEAGALTLTIVRSELRRIVDERAKSDPNIHYLDGLELFGAADVAMLGDGLHPDAAGYRMIGERFAALAFGTGGAFNVG